MRAVGIGLAIVGVLIIAGGSRFVPKDQSVETRSFQPIAAAQVKDAAVEMPPLVTAVDPSMNPLAIQLILRWQHRRDSSAVVVKSNTSEVIYDVQVLLDGKEVHRGTAAAGPRSKTEQRLTEGSDQQTLYRLEVTQPQQLEVRTTLRRCEDIYCNRSAAHFSVIRNEKNRFTAGVLISLTLGVLVMLSGIFLARKK